MLPSFPNEPANMIFLLTSKILPRMTRGIRPTCPPGAPFCAPGAPFLCPRGGHLFVPRGHLFMPRGHLFMPRGHLFICPGVDQWASFCALGSTFCALHLLNLHLILTYFFWKNDCKWLRIRGWLQIWWITKWWCGNVKRHL
jgi:hypothetical protein